MPIYTPREKYNAFSSPIFKENIIHFAGNSYLQVLPGDAEIILVGEYVSDDEAAGIARDPVSQDITIPLGDGPVLDEFRVAEIETYNGTYLALVFTGSFQDGDRRVAHDSSDRTFSQGSESFQNVRSTIRAVSEDSIVYDTFMSGVNDSPGPEVRNSPTSVTVPVSPFPVGGIALTKIIGGVRVASQSFHMGTWSFRRKPRIGVSAELSPFSHGQVKDLIKGPINTKTYDITSPHGAIGDEGPVKVKFYVSGSLTTGMDTNSQNVSATAEVTTPYVDGHSNSRNQDIDSLIVTT